jgi:hypothetical protein
MAKLHIEKFCQFADKITLPFSLSDVRAIKHNPLREQRLDARCQQLAKNHISSRSFSAQYFGKDGIPMFFYLGQRIADDPPLEYTLSEEEMGSMLKSKANRSSATALMYVYPIPLPALL